MTLSFLPQLIDAISEVNPTSQPVYKIASQIKFQATKLFLNWITDSYVKASWQKTFKKLMRDKWNIDFDRIRAIGLGSQYKQFSFKYKI